MRLNPEWAVGIAASIAAMCPKVAYELYLVGSRTDDSALGGDIDLLVRADTASQEAAIRQVKERILNKIKAAIGDQRVDLTIASAERVDSDPVLAHMMITAIRLDEGRNDSG